MVELWHKGSVSVIVQPKQEETFCFSGHSPQVTVEQLEELWKITLLMRGGREGEEGE